MEKNECPQYVHHINKTIVLWTDDELLAWAVGYTRIYTRMNYKVPSSPVSPTQCRETMDSAASLLKP